MKQPAKKRSRHLSRAVHEAGHAVVSIFLGRAVRFIEATPGHEQHTAVCVHFKTRGTPYSMSKEQRERWGIMELSILFAGQLAQARLLGRRPRHWEGYLDDTTAADIAGMVCPNGREAQMFLNWVVERSRGLVEMLWVQILAVGEELAGRGSSGRMTGREIHGIMRGTLKT